MDRILCEMDDFVAAGHKKIACLPRPAAKARKQSDKALRGLSCTKRYRRMATAYAPGCAIGEIVLGITFRAYA